MSFGQSVSYSTGYTVGGSANFGGDSFQSSGLQVVGSSGAVAFGDGFQSSGYQVLQGSSGSSGAVGFSEGFSSSSNVVQNVASDLLALRNAGGASFAAGSGASFAAGSSASFEASAFSAVEQAILNASNPIAVSETEEISINGQTGIWANKQEIINWRGVIPITQYLINVDSNPEIIRKRTEQQLLYEQEIAIRYLRPPTPPPPGEILIRQEKNIATPPAPPLVIRQQPPRPETPAPLVIREAPPRPPASVGQKVITISGKRLPPPPRKVIIERLAPLPSKPQSIMIERWLPYSQNKRRVIFQRNEVPDPIVAKPRNVIIQWEAPAVQIKKEFKDLGVIRANPVEYVQRYGASLKTHIELPAFVKEIRPPVGVVLAADYTAPSLFELEGDINALSLIDLDREGLGEYRAWLARFLGGGASASFSASSSSAASAFSVSIQQMVNAVLVELFATVDRNADGRISVSESEKVLLKLNSRLGRNYGEDDVRAFFSKLDSNRDGYVDFEEFKRGIFRDLNISA